MLLCPRIRTCQNTLWCHQCKDYSRYKPPLPPREGSRLTRKGNKAGAAFEKKVVEIYNKVARRRPASGAFWDKPGDVIAPDMLMEAKERGTRTSKGEKTISILKEWLLKVEREALAAGRHFWCLPFRFKGDDRVYAVVDFEDLVALVETVRGEKR